MSKFWSRTTLLQSFDKFEGLLLSHLDGEDDGSSEVGSGPGAARKWWRRPPNNFSAQRAKSRFALILSLLFQGGLIEKIVSNHAFPA